LYLGGRLICDNDDMGDAEIDARIALNQADGSSLAAQR
jgi:hypothetical protein